MPKTKDEINLYQRNRRKIYGDRVRETERLSRYNITPEIYQSILISQDYRCAICKELLEVGCRLIENPDYNDKRTPCIDHNHRCCGYGKSCGKCIRGILCRQCNHGLGNFKDSVELLRSAADYVECKLSIEVLP